MKLARLQVVNRHAEERQALLRMIDVLNDGSHCADAYSLQYNGPKYCITIDGERLDETMLALVRPVLLGELRARVRRIDADLGSLGVEVTA